MSIGRYYTVAQVSEITQYHQLTIRRAIYGREMAVYRNGPRGQIRIPESELKRWMKSKEIPAAVTLGPAAELVSIGEGGPQK